MEANQVQPVPSSNAGVAACMIVPEVLKEDNYERWRIFMQHYLVAQDLWDVILSSEMPHGEDSREWIKRNAFALHAIKISCGAKMFDGIKEMNSAKDAWNALADLHKQPNEHGNKDTGIETVERKQASIFVQSNAGVAACMIVPEVLKEDNYEWWRIFMEHYLVAQDLWDVVLGEDPREWIKRNALALHAIKISCGAEQFDRIKKMNIAKDAWNALAASHKQPNEDGNKDAGIRTVERKQAVTLLKDIKKGDSDAVKKLFETHPPYSAVLENGSTALHVAITTGKTELAKKLISVMSENELETQDKSGKTVLSLAACKGSRNIVECLVRKNKKLLEIPDSEKKIPLVLACAGQHNSLTRYLYSETCKKFLDPAIGDHGFFLLKECIRNHMFDIGLDLLREFPNLTFHTSSLEPTPIISVLVEMLSPVFNENKFLLFCRSLIFDYPKHARELVFFICDQQLSTLERDQFMSSGAVEATFKAIKLGYLDFVKQITEANPDIVWSRDPEHSRDMLMYAVAHRQQKIAQFLWGLNAWKNMTECTIDDDQNNMLHLAAKLDPSHPYIHHSSDPLLRMQSEGSWFKEVKGIVPKFYREQRNKDGETPLEVFRREHQGFLEEAQTWVKETVNFATVISTLIIGIMFAASITFPGGNNDRDGFPIFSKRSSFNDFLGCDLASVLFASLSVLLFLDIHKSSLTEEAFLYGLLIPKLVWSFYFLFWSIGCMLICFFISIDLVDPKAISPLPLNAVVFGGPFILIFLKQLLPFFKILRLRIFRTESTPSCLIVYGHFFQRTET